MPEDRVLGVVDVHFLAYLRGASCNKLISLSANQRGSLWPVPRRLARNPDVDVYPVLCGLSLGHAKPSDRRASSVRVDDRRAVRVVVARLGNVTERESPERRQSVWVKGIGAD